jgi:hypothetical protein
MTTAGGSDRVRTKGAVRLLLSEQVVERAAT